MNKRALAYGIAGIIALLAVYTFWHGQRGPHVPDGIAYGNGRIEAVQVDISTKIAGRVRDISVSEGDLVQPDQILARINDDELQAKRQKSQADIASAISAVAAAKAKVSQSKAQLNLARKELERATDLVKKGHTSKEVFDTRVSQHAVADANLIAAQANQVSAERAVDATRATAQEIQTRIDDCNLTSPTVGRVLYRLAEPGEVLSPGGKVLTLLNLADIYMEIFLPPSQAHRLSIGSEARIKLDILKPAIPAKVSFVAPQSQFTPKQVETASEREKLMFRVKVRVPKELVRQHIEKVKTGVRGVAYVMLDNDEPEEWPDFLQQLPKSVQETDTIK